ncbi:ATP-binding cassette domain-containing protein [Trinickia sp. LjRoot230]|uniref:ATP-binding cassette domain-containing protein n=1 Tax=Trinickia sp. LjRoot230 TaxID=3342288 RepID=UPI003ECC96E3
MDTIESQAQSQAQARDDDFILALENVSRYFGNVIALKDVTLKLRRGEVHCLLGDNGAGKSTLIKTLAGVHAPSDGVYRVDGNPVHFTSPKDALDLGIATVYQDLALVPLLSVARNFFMGREPQRKLFGLVNVMDIETAATTARNKLAEMGIHVRDANQPIGTMSGGERQCLAIARAIHFGARVLILDEPTAALGVKQSFNVLRLIHKARERGISVIFITHNVHHAYPIGDSFTLLNRGRSMGTFTKDTISKEAVLDMMAGGAEMQKMIAELDGATI